MENQHKESVEHEDNPLEAMSTVEYLRFVARSVRHYREVLHIAQEQEK